MRQSESGWSYPEPPKYVSQEIEFDACLFADLHVRFADDTERTFRAGESFPIAGYRTHDDGRTEIALVDGRTFYPSVEFDVSCKTLGNSWGGVHDSAYMANVVNARSKQQAIERKLSAYAFVVVAKETQTGIQKALEFAKAFYVPVRPYRNQVNRGKTN
jgi:hypothetical protein